MKIGILTFHRPANFGANLQAYSTYTYLSSLGYDVKVIDYVKAANIKHGFYKSRPMLMKYHIRECLRSIKHKLIK